MDPLTPTSRSPGRGVTSGDTWRAATAIQLLLRGPWVASERLDVSAAHARRGRPPRRGPISPRRLLRPGGPGVRGGRSSALGARPARAPSAPSVQTPAFMGALWWAKRRIGCAEAMAAGGTRSRSWRSMKRAKRSTDGGRVCNTEGEPRWWLGALAVIKATAADTGGHLTVVDVTDPLVLKRRSMFITRKARPSGSSRVT
jgi:hypothetical protein